MLPDGGLAYPTNGSYTEGSKYSAYFEPGDISTLWGHWDYYSLTVSPWNEQDWSAVKEGWMRDLAGRVSIRTWPEMEEVPATNTATADPSRNIGSMIEIVPNTKLEDRWYVMRLSAPPIWMEVPQSHVAPDGSLVARFRVGSEPLIAHVDFYAREGKHLLFLEASEPVGAKPLLTTLVQVQNGGVPVVCQDPKDTDNGGPTFSLRLDCPTLTALPDEITIGAGVVSTTGVPLAPATIRKADLVLTGPPDNQWGYVQY